MDSIRSPTIDEKRLIELLVNQTSIENLSVSWIEKLLVETMEDGKMGSLRLFPNGIINNNRLFGKQASEYEFNDADGIKVIASLYLDRQGELFELDIWKINFKPLIEIPKNLT